MQTTSTTQTSMLNKLLKHTLYSKRITLLVFIALFSNWSLSQDLPSPPPNNKTLEAGSYVVAMDNLNQANSKNVFNNLKLCIPT